MGKIKKIALLLLILSLALGVAEAAETISISQKAVLSSIADLPATLDQARMEPYLKRQRVVGFRISQIKKGSIYSHLQLKEGDVILKVNGQVMDSVWRALALLPSASTMKQVTLDILRQKKPKKLIVLIEATR